MRTSRVSTAPFLAASGAWLLGCAAPQPRVQTGPDAIVTEDGLHKVDHVELGSLFVRPDYEFGSYERFYLGDTDIDFKRGSRVLDRGAAEQVKGRFDAVARAAIRQTGRVEVEEPGPCVALVTLSLLDLELLDPKDMAGARTTVVDSFGAATLVLDIRDGHTGEALLRYGRRRRLEGGVATGADPALGQALDLAFQRLAADFTRDFERSLPRVEPPEPVVSCEVRAGLLAPPPVGSGPE